MVIRWGTDGFVSHPTVIIGQGGWIDLSEDAS